MEGAYRPLERKEDLEAQCGVTKLLLPEQSCLPSTLEAFSGTKTLQPDFRHNLLPGGPKVGLYTFLFLVNKEEERRICFLKRWRIIDCSETVEVVCMVEQFYQESAN